ncbi:hypothetical protein BGZ46_001525 [Entomortierella lignicola]|nr:hypothetical protein BGZ46_001525 [Entomortierella lignicola]
MASTAIQGEVTDDSDNEGPLETDPSSRYQRCDEILGEGAYKVVYRACDLEVGNEVAWNQLRLDNISKREAKKILSEIEILQSIRNEHIINFYSSWLVPTENGRERIVFITELMSSGTLKQYLKKTLKGALKPKVVKAWCRQILQGLAYLHARDPPIIHRDLKCDNIFINGNNGQLKIGDLGLAVVRHRTHVSSVLGTPEFMAPELYEEKYNEKVDIYAFGMCVLEMVTKEYPYSECTNQAQIYRKVSQGIKPLSLEHVQDLEIKEFIDRCLDHNPCTRPSAQELLVSDFLKPCLESEPLSPYLRSDTSSATHQSPSFVTIPPAEFTLTTVDVDNKTYHIRSNLLPTPTSPLQDPLAAAQQSTDGLTPDTHGHQRSVPGQPHSHANSKLCSIQVIEYGERVRSRLNLKMICTCPVAGSQNTEGETGTHEIKFPFDLEVDTVEEVVSEMIREKILSPDDKGEAMTRMNVLVTNILREQIQPKKEDLEIQAKNGLSLSSHSSPILSQTLTPSVKVDSIPPLDPTTFPPTSPQVIPPFAQHSAQPTQSQVKPQATSVKPWSPPLAPRITHAMKTPSRPKSVHELGRQASYSILMDNIIKTSSMSGISVPQTSSDGISRPRERQRSTSTTAFENEDDIGYTSPYRHGGSVSSVKSHRRTPSCDTSASISKTLSVPTSLRIFNPPEPGVGRSRAQSDFGQFVASAPNFPSLMAHAKLLSEQSSMSSIVQSLEISSSSVETPSASIVVSGFDTSKKVPDPAPNGSIVTSGFDISNKTPVTKGEETDSGISSGASSPASKTLDGKSPQEQLPTQKAIAAIPLLVPVHQQDLLSPRTAIRASPHIHIDDSVHPMSSSISSDGSYNSMIMMTNEAKRDIELWSNNVAMTRDQVVPSEETNLSLQGNLRSSQGLYKDFNGSVASLGYGDLTDEDEEIIDEEMRILREQQLQEIERMRLQHEREWREMMRLKELKDKAGIETRVRRLSEANGAARLI